MSFPPRYTLESHKRRPRRRAEETQQQIVDSAVEHIADVGFHKMSIAEVAAASGISQSGLLHHFPSKAALLTAVLERRERDDNEFLFGDGTVPLGWDAFDALVSLGARNATRPEWVGVFVRVSAEATESDHPAHDWLRRHYTSTRRWLTDALEHGKSDGTIRADVPVELVADNTIAVLDGLQQQWLLDRPGIDMVRRIRAHVDGLKAAWSAPHPGG
ncbi:TetR/AcrR family transcriptional regulator [Pseudonocardia sp. C8]|uniref:TetR/AcrR family transcriptional regulator n=1 Tax=Pseudonocardia sp. C8 TaxID=2762759 RepID=UPI00164350BD|nr:TetR/AcrR family transcriptional regulator [Pseudonocardia sp. C8]MBC3194889.1 TetR/AcrR family transcriptional regulator [Pseudonocardia sp. C8]